VTSGSVRRGRRPRPWGVFFLWACAVAWVADAPPVGAETSVVLLVISEGAEVRTGPGFAYRAIYSAQRGETLVATDRAPNDYWFRVILPDGTYGWILGDLVLPQAVDPNPPGPPTLFQRLGRAIFSPPPLGSTDIGLSFSAGLLGGEGLALFRPMVLLAPHLGLEVFVGETVGEQADVVYYGGAGNLFLWPASPVTPFFSLGGGGAVGRKKADQFAIDTGHYLSANAGGGMLVAFKKRITVRFDFRSYVVFDADYTRSLQEYSGGLAVFF